MPRRRCKRLTDELVGAFRVRGAGSSAARRKFCEVHVWLDFRFCQG